MLYGTETGDEISILNDDGNRSRINVFSTAYPDYRLYIINKLEVFLVTLARGTGWAITTRFAASEAFLSDRYFGSSLRELLMTSFTAVVNMLSDTRLRDLLMSMMS